MIPVPLYSTVYIVIIAILSIMTCFRLITTPQTRIENNNINNIWNIAFLLIAILFIGLRDPWGAFEYFGDTGVYTRAYMSNFGVDLWEQTDVGFSFLIKSCSYVLNIQMFYLLCAFLYVMPVYYTFKKWFGNLAIYALVVYITTMSFWPFGINGIRNGLAVSFFIFALGNINKKWLMIIFMLLAVSMHKSILLTIIVFFIANLIKNTRWVVVIWFLSIIISLVIGQGFANLFNNDVTNLLNDNRLESYSNNTWKIDAITKNIRFRLDFILYSFSTILLGWYYVLKKGFKDKFYIRLLHTYILTNAVWIAFFMYAAFTNRFAYLSWCIMPVVMIYPLLKTQLVKNQYRFISIMIFGNLLFTLIMFFR